MNDHFKPASRSLKGKVAVVTGAGSRGDGIGNGRAAAILLAMDGARVALLDVDEDAAKVTMNMISAEGGESFAIACDITSDADVAAAIQQVTQRWGGIDILVNNVGIGGPAGDAVTLDLEGWDKGMRINVTSMMLLARHCVPEMRKRNSGSIVNISSVAGLMGGNPNLLYPTSKGAVVNMTRAMAAHYGEDGIRVNCVAPGMVYTPMVSSKGMSEEVRAIRRKRSLLQVEGSGWDVGHAVRFLAGDEARWITGVVLPVDAGATAGRHSYK